MGMQYETMRQYIWDWGWRPVSMMEGGRKVLAWKNEERDRFCQDIEAAYAITTYNTEVTKQWTI